MTELSQREFTHLGDVRRSFRELENQLKSLTAKLEKSEDELRAALAQGSQ